MTDHSIYISQLLQKHLTTALSPQEQTELDDWVHSDPAHKELFDFLTDPDRIKPELKKMFGYDKQGMAKKLKARSIEWLGKTLSRQQTAATLPIPVRRMHFLRKWGWTAASIILLLAAGTYFWPGNRHAGQPLAEGNKPAQMDIPPGGNKAILTLSDGTAIVLDSAADGAIAQQGNANIIKLKSGQLIYNLNRGSAAQVMINTMKTPRGGQYQLTLPDGTRVWLNALSSITYPAFFVEKERVVRISGEVYFEVAKNNKPFRVRINDQTEIEVLGTNFNVNAYADETTIKTTLLKGSVKIINNGSARMLSPGTQARVNNSLGGNEDIQVVNDIDMDAIMAWKNGYFSFEQTDLPTVMRQISRWYDVDVVYAGKIPNRKFGGGITRSVNLYQVLKIFEEMKVDFKIEGRKIIVQP